MAVIRAEPRLLGAIVAKLVVDHDGAGLMKLSCPLQNHDTYIDPGAGPLGDAVWCTDESCDPGEVVSALEYLARELPDRCSGAETDPFHHRASCPRCQLYAPRLRSAMQHLAVRTAPGATDNPMDSAPTALHRQRYEYHQADRWGRRMAALAEVAGDDDGWVAQSLTDAPPIPPPTILEIGVGTGDFLIREGWITLVHGAFGSGKTPLCYLAVVEQVKKGNLALILDHEMADSQAVGLLRELGLTDGEIDSGVYFVYDPPPPTDAGRNRLVKEIEERQEGTGRRLNVAVIDSLTESMGTVPGADDGKAADVTAWADSLPKWLRDQFGAAVLVIDHSGVNDGPRPANSHKKREVVQFHLWVRKDVEFSREEPEAGCSTILVYKDRSGDRRPGKAVAVLRTKRSFYLEPPDSSKPSGDEVHVDLSRVVGLDAESEVLAELRRAGAVGMAKSTLTGSGEAGKYRREAFDKLKDDGRSVERRVGRSKWCWASECAPAE